MKKAGKSYRRVLCLLDEGRAIRAQALIAEGLCEHPNLETIFNAQPRLLGQPIGTKIPEAGILATIETFDLILLTPLATSEKERWITAIDERQLWPRTVIVDYRDSPELSLSLLQKSTAYFKRSWPIGPGRQPRENVPANLLPIHYAALGAFDKLGIPLDGERPIDVGYYFTPDIEDVRRRRVLEYLRTADWGAHQTRIGFATIASGILSHRIVSEPPTPESFWVKYMELLARTKIVFSATPEGWDGDSRTWEALWSGALCFLDRNHIPVANFPEHGRHCFFYDAADSASVAAAVVLAREMLRPENAVIRSRIAAAGRQHLLRHHLAVNRIDDLLRAFDRLSMLNRDHGPS